MTTLELQSTGFIITPNEVSITEINYRNYLNEFDNSEMKMWVEEIKNQLYWDGEKEITQDEYDFIDYELRREIEKSDTIGSGKFEIWAQKINRKAERCIWLGEFDSEEEAELEIYQRTADYISEKNWDAPVFWDSKEEAIEDLAGSLEKPAEVISRYLAIAAITARKDAEHRAKVTAEHNAHKEWLAIEVPKEADSIAIDEQFQKDIAAACILKSKDKSNACEQALSALLNRLQIKIKTDFWQVLRILKSKVL